MKLLNRLKLRSGIYARCLREDLLDLAHCSLKLRDPDQFGAVPELTSKGFCVVRSYYDAETCRTLREEFERVARVNSSAVVTDPEGADHRIWGIDRVSPTIRRFHSEPDLEAAAKRYLKAEVTNYLTLGAKLEFSLCNKGSGGGWHRDSIFEKQFKAILYLSDVSEENGPFQYIRGSNRKTSVLRSLDFIKGESPTRMEDFDFVTWCSSTGNFLDTFVGKTGDLILADTRGIHRGMPIRSGNRYSLTNYYVVNHRYPLFKSYFDPLIKFDEITRAPSVSERFS